MKLSFALAAATLTLSFATSFSAMAQTNTENYEYGIYVVRSLPTDLKPQMTLEQILEADTVNARVKEAVSKSIAESQTSLLRSLFIDKSVASVNLQTEISKSLKQFNERLKINLAQAQVAQSMEFQVHISPMISKILAARRAGNPVTARIVYPTDRVSLVEVMPDVAEVHEDEQRVILGDIYQGIAARLNDQYIVGAADPFFVSLTINLKVNPAPQDSMWIAQAVVGLPVNKSMPFEQANDQIAFKKVEFPTYTTALGISTEDLPTALITIEQPLSKSTGKMLLEFGPIGTFRDGRWVRPQDPSLYAKLTPKLVGTPAIKLVSGRLDVAFNVLNLSMDIESQGVSDLDLYLSVGLPKFPGTRVGFINKADIDQQFQTEINKAIKAAIQDQQKKLKEQGLAKAEALTSISAPMLEQLITKLLSTKQGGK